MPITEIDTATLFCWVREREAAVLSGNSLSTKRENQQMLDMFVQELARRGKDV